MAEKETAATGPNGAEDSKEGIKTIVSEQEKKILIAQAKLRLTTRAGTKNRPSPAPATGSASKRGRFAIPRASDQRVCSHAGTYLFWKAQGDGHKWVNDKDMAGDPNKQAAVANIVYGMAKLAAEQNVSRPYLTWPNDWHAAIEQASSAEPVNRTPRLFRDKSFPFVVSNHANYQQFSIDGDYFDTIIKTDDFVPGSNNENPAFKNRLSSLLVNIMWRHTCHLCPLFVRIDIGSNTERNFTVPFIRATIDCRLAVCNQRFTAIFKDAKRNKDNRISFELFSERYRSLSIVPKTWKVNNSTKTLVAGECGKCMVKKYVKLVPGLATAAEEVEDFVRPTKRVEFEFNQTNHSPFHKNVKGFDVVVAAHRYNLDRISHKEKTDKQTINSLLCAVGLEKEIYSGIYDVIQALFVEFKIGKIPYLNKDVLVCLDDDFKNACENDLLELMRPFCEIVTNAHCHMVWPRAIDCIDVKQEVQTESGEDCENAIGMDEEEEYEDENQGEIDLSDDDIFERFAGNPSDLPGSDQQQKICSDLSVTVSTELSTDANSHFALRDVTAPSPDLEVTNRELPNELEQPANRNSPTLAPSDAMLEPKIENQLTNPAANPPSILVDQNTAGRLDPPASLQELLTTPIGNIFIPAAAFENLYGQNVIPATSLLILKR